MINTIIFFPFTYLLTAISVSIYSGISLLYLKNHTNEQNIMIPHIPVIIRTHLNAPGSSNIGIEKFIPKMPATTPKIATTNVAVVSSSSNWISWFRTLSCDQNHALRALWCLNII